MKKTVLAILGMMIVMGTFSQTNNQGSVIYDEIMKIDIQIDNMTPEMAEMIPTENRNTTILYFNEDASRYENYESKDDALIDDMSEGGGVQIMISQPDNIIYNDLKSGKSIEQTEFMTRVFLIESVNLSDDWKFTGNQKMILDFPCQEAVKNEGDDDVKVWFTPAIPVSTGPGKYGRLPGLILAIEANNGDISIMANSVKFENINEDKLKKPKKGKKVTNEEFRTIVEEKSKEMGGDGNTEGSQTIIMKISQ